MLDCILVTSELYTSTNSEYVYCLASFHETRSPELAPLHTWEVENASELEIDAILHISLTHSAYEDQTTRHRPDSKKRLS